MDVADLLVHEGRVDVQPERLPVVQERLVPLLLLHAHVRQVVVDLARLRRIAIEGLPQDTLALGQDARPRVGDRLVQVGLHVVGLDLEGLLVMPDGGVVVAVAQAEVSRVEADLGLHTGARAGEIAQPLRVELGDDPEGDQDRPDDQQGDDH